MGLGMLGYYRRWLATAFSGALDRTALAAFVVLSAMEVGKHFIPKAAAMLTSWVWAVPFWMFAAVIVARVMYAPYVMWREQQAAMAAAGTLSDSKAERKAVREALASFLQKAGALDLLCRTNSESQWMALNDWFECVVDYLGASLDQSYVQRFGADSGFTHSTPIGPYNQIQQHQLTWLNHRSQRLQEFIREFV
jgi:hypothetical protein